MLVHSIGYLLHYDKYQKEVDFRYALRNIVSRKIIEEGEYYKHQLLGFENDDKSSSITANEYAKLITDQVRLHPQQMILCFFFFYKFTWGGTMNYRDFHFCQIL